MMLDISWGVVKDKPADSGAWAFKLACKWAKVEVKVCGTSTDEAAMSSSSGGSFFVLCMQLLVGLGFCAVVIWGLDL